MGKKSKHEPRNFRTAAEQQAETDAKMAEHRTAVEGPAAQVGLDMASEGVGVAMNAPSADAPGQVPAAAAAPAAHPPIDGPVPLLGKTADDAAKAAHAEGLFEDAKPEPEKAADPETEFGAAESAEDRQLIWDAAEKVFEDGGEPPGEDQPAKEPEPPTEEAKAMASMLDCATAMCGLLNDESGLQPPDVAMCLADFYRHEPTAPAAAGLMHLKLKLKVILLPNEDPRRVELILDLFRLAVIRMEEFIAADAKAEIARQAAPLPTARNRLDGEGAFDRDDDRLTKSDTGKALDRRTV